MLGFQQFGDGGAQSVGEFGEDADDLALLGVLQVTKLVVGIEDLCRFDEDGLARGRLIVDEALETALELGGHGDTQPAVADGHLRVLLDQAVLFGHVQDLADLPVGGLRYAVDLTLDTAELV